eukprot:scaffold23556_cov129-Isochrysis_galbana.AAC.2
MTTHRTITLKTVLWSHSHRAPRAECGRVSPRAGGCWNCRLPLRLCSSAGALAARAAAKKRSWARGALHGGRRIFADMELALGCRMPRMRRASGRGGLRLRGALLCFFLPLAMPSTEVPLRPCAPLSPVQCEQYL